MKSKYFVVLMSALILLSFGISAKAAADIIPFNVVLTGNESLDVVLPSTTNNKKITKAPASADVAASYENPESDNVCYKLFGGNNAAALIINVMAESQGNAYLGSAIKRSSARVKLPQTETGETRMFVLRADYTNGVSADTSGVLLKNGGAYYYNMETQSYVSFIDDGTMAANEWYTVETTIDSVDVSEGGVLLGGGIMMNAVVYDASGKLMGKSGWANVSNLKPYYNSTLKKYVDHNYISTQVNVRGYNTGEYVMVDDIARYTVSISGAVCTGQSVDTVNYKKAEFTFSEEFEEATVTKENVSLFAENEALDISDKYDISYDGQSKTITLSFNELPYGENYIIKLTKRVCTIDGFRFPSEIETKFSTGPDPLSITNITFTDANGQAVSAGSDVKTTFKLRNPSDRTREYMIVVTSWNSKNECIDIKNVYGFSNPGSEVNLILPNVRFEDAGSVIRLSLINNWQKMNPVGNVIIFSL